MGPRRHLSPRKDFACCKKKQGKDTKHIFSCPRCRRDCSSDIVDHPLFEWLGVATCIDCKTRCPGKQEEDTATFGICRTCPGGKQFYGANIGVAAYWKHVNDFRKYHPVGSCIKKSRPTWSNLHSLANSSVFTIILRHHHVTCLPTPPLVFWVGVDIHRLSRSSLSPWAWFLSFLAIPYLIFERMEFWMYHS